MARPMALLLVAALCASPLRAQQDSARRHTDSLVTLIRSIVRNRDQIRVIQSEDRFIVEQPARWLDTLRQPGSIRVIQVRGNSAGTGARIGGMIGLLAGTAVGVAAGVSLANFCLGECPAASASENRSAGILGAIAGGFGGAMIGTAVGALVGLGIPSWHTRVTVRPDGRIEIR